MTKRDRLIETAIRLFQERGFWDTPTALIAREAGVANGTLFNNFPSKADLLEAVYLHIKQAWADAVADAIRDLPGAPADNLAAVWRAGITWALDHPAEYGLVHQMKLSAMVSDAAGETGMALFGPWRDILTDLRERAGQAPLDPLYLEQLAAAQLDTAIAWTARGSNSERADRIDTSFTILLASLGLPPQETPS